MLLLLALILMAVSVVALSYSLKPSIPTRRTKPIKDIVVGGDEKNADLLSEKDKEIENLRTKLKKTKEDYQILENELIESKKIEGAALDELKKIKGWMDMGQDSQESVKREIFELRGKLAKKDEEYEQEFSSNLRLKNEVKEYKDKLDAQVKTNQELDERMRILELQNKTYKEELKKEAEILAELKKRNQETEWVSKKEYDRLKELLDKNQQSGQ